MNLQFSNDMKQYCRTKPVLPLFELCKPHLPPLILGPSLRPATCSLSNLSILHKVFANIQSIFYFSEYSYQNLGGGLV